jgi:hypothetical protein
MLEETRMDIEDSEFSYNKENVEAANIPKISKSLKALHGSKKCIQEKKMPLQNLLPDPKSKSRTNPNKLQLNNYNLKSLFPQMYCKEELHLPQINPHTHTHTHSHPIPPSSSDPLKNTETTQKADMQDTVSHDTDSMEEIKEQDSKESKESKEDLSEITKFTIDNFGIKIMEFMHLKQELFKKGKFLHNHRINQYVRAKMVDWMVEVFAVYAYDEESFFMAVNIMDKYLATTESNYKNQDIHLLGMVAMYVSSKLEDINPLRAKDVQTHIGHGSFTLQQIHELERRICQTLQYKLIFTSQIQFLRNYIAQLQFFLVIFFLNSLLFHFLFCLFNY